MRVLLALLALAVLAPAAAAQVPADAGGPLVYVFVLDGLDGDKVDEGKAPFLSSLLAGEGAHATYYRESRSVMVAETNPNHTAMATGAFGDRSGIPGNAFAVYDAAAQGACPTDGATAGAPAETDGQAADCVLAENFFTAARRQAGAEAITTAGIFGKPKLARLFSTRRAVAAPAFDADYLWTPCEAPGDDTPYCKTVPLNPATMYAASDGIVMDEVLRSVREGVDADGARKRPNLTFVNLPQIDSAGHATGTGAAYDAAIGLADDELRRFADQQRSLGLWERTVMLVVSDHSMDTTGDKASLDLRFRAAGIASGDYLIVQNGSVDMVYLTDRGRADRDTLLAKLRAAALPVADEALYRVGNPADGGAAHTLDTVHPGWRIAGERSGDLFVTRGAGAAWSDPANPLTGNHGGPLTSDNTFAVISGGEQVRRQSLSGVVGARFDDTLANPGQAQNVDVAPTVLALLGRGAPADSEGRVLGEAFAPGVLPTGGGGGGGGSSACVATPALRSLRVRAVRRGLRIGFRRTGSARVSVDVVRASRGRRVVSRVVARFPRRARGFVWRGRGAGRGEYVVRLRTRDASGARVTRRVAVHRGARRFSRRPAIERSTRCGVLRSLRLSRPVFGSRRAAWVSFSLRRPAVGSATVLRRGGVVRRFPARSRRAGKVHRLRIAGGSLRRGHYRIRLRLRADGRTATYAVTARRL